MKKRRITTNPVFGLFLILSIAACSDKSNKQKPENSKPEVPLEAGRTPEVDTLRINDFVVYNVTKDTLIGNLQISVTNKNIDEKYIHQCFYLNDSMVVMNYYPEMESTVEIKQEDLVVFKKTYLKKDFPKGNFYEFRQNATIKDFRFESIDKENKVFFIATLSIPNTHITNDFYLTVSEKGKSCF